ncbi:uncharacterized protein [Solanum tuberosum]|uniref:uncharacterized protein n=1 Tax=Solanum tuberosum TaxID=4113 RepID=UPI00073A0593|nr:PREDICTED: uncharacterized protein LOC107061588 [Solanum tuberosum]
MVNGETTPPFNVAKGLRQRDLISPYLFAISMEYLSRCLAEAREFEGFKFHPKCGRLNITHLCFADDLLLFSRGDQKSVKIIYQCFQKFSQASGLQANMNKISIYFGGVPDQVKRNILQQSGFGCGEFPFKYLGVPLSTKKLTIMQWSPLVNKIIARISSWTAKKFSYAGRMQLVQSVLFGIQAYWSQLFIIPAKVLKLIESYCRSFTWSGSNTINKRALIAWEKVCLPKSVGGMNLINIRLWNQAAIAKICWDLANKSDKLWIRWIHSFYIKTQQFLTATIPKQASWMVKKILNARLTLEQTQKQNDQVTIGNLYLSLLGNRPRVPWRCLIFANSARPKAIVTMWLQLQNKLPTSDRLASWGIDINQQCKLCQNELETRDHLFVCCELQEHFGGS